MLHRHVLHNDALCDVSDTTLSPGQVGLLAGWGVFTTIKVTAGVLFAFERHWARISRDAAALHVAIPQDSEAVRRKLLDLVQSNQALDSTLRLVIVRNDGSMWAGPSNGRKSDLIALTADSKDWGGQVKLSYVPNARHAASAFAGTKILSWAMNLTWIESAQKQGFDEVILLNERGEVAECTSANIFAVRQDRVFTPPLSSGCLPGITREVLLGEIAVPGIRFEERTLMPADLEKADEVFITSTTRNLLPVGQIGGRDVAGEGRVCARLNSAFSDFVQRYVAEQRGVPAV